MGRATDRSRGSSFGGWLLALLLVGITGCESAPRPSMALVLIANVLWPRPPPVLTPEEVCLCGGTPEHGCYPCP